MLKQKYPEKKMEIIEEYDTGYYFVDIFVKELNLVIEVDGLNHYTGSNIISNSRTRIKKQVLEKLGYNYLNLSVIRYLSLKDKEGYIVKELSKFLKTI